MEQINISTNGKAIQTAYSEVVRGDGDFTWVIYGPDKSKAYQVAETGSDFNEFLASFDESQIQFGLARVNPPNSDVFKNLLIGWCPDAAPLKSRSSFAQNFAEVSRLLKGYHVQVTARDADDLDKNDLLARLSAAAGARYSIQSTRANSTSAATSGRPTPKAFVPKPSTSSVSPVSSASRPVPLTKPEPQVIKPTNRFAAANDEDEWNEPEVQERDFSKNPLKPNSSTWKPIGKVNLQELIKEEKARSDPRLEVEQLKQKDKLKRENELDEYLKTKSASGSARAPLPTSGINKIAGSGGISKDFGSNNGKTPAQLWAERKQKANGVSPATKPLEPTAQPVEEGEVSVADLKSKFIQLDVETEKEEKEEKEEKILPKRTPISLPKRVSQPQEEDEVSVADLKSKFNQLDVETEKEEEAEKILPKRTPISLPKRVSEPQQEDEDLEDDSEWQDQQQDEEEEEEEEERNAPQPSLPSRSAIPPPAAVAKPDETEEEEEEDEEPEQEATDDAEVSVVVAIAEYDYEASEDNELTFAEGQKIINIEMIDEDWWLGELEGGEKGLFPSNYVNIQ